MAGCRIPLVVVLGATGAGKSKLAIEIAKAFKGEIISADSMQIYKGLDIITNKVTQEEQLECVHHLISYLDADHKHYNIVDFRDAAVPIINDLLAKQRMPVLVGGTNYYIESVLWDFLVDTKKKATTSDSQQLKDTYNQLDQHNTRKPGETTHSSSHILLADQNNKSMVEFSSSSKQLEKKNLTLKSKQVPEIVDMPMTPASSCMQKASLAFGQTFNQSSASKTEPFVISHSGAGVSVINSTMTTTSSCFTSQSCYSESDLQEDCQLRIADSHSGKDSSSSISSAFTLHPPSSCSAPNLASDIEPYKIEMTEIEISGTSTSGDNSLFTGDIVGSYPSVTQNCLKSPRNDKDPATESSHGGMDSILSSYSSSSSVDEDSEELEQDLEQPRQCPGINSAISSPLTCNDLNSLTRSHKDLKNDPQVLLQRLNDMSPGDLYSLLQRVDPVSGSRMHPNNRRKIIRALQVYYETGRTLSSVLSDQHGGMENVKSGSLRYSNPCILWVKCDQPELDQRLDNRVDDMLARGLVSELENFSKEARRLEDLKHKSSGQDTGHAYPHGILQMIGFKEFHNYLQLPPKERATEVGQKYFNQGVYELKQVTRHYARQQERWIRNRFCSRPGPNVPPVYSVNSTDLTQWDKAVEDAIAVVRAFVTGEKPDKAPEVAGPKVESVMIRNVCDVCGGKIFLYLHEWKGHVKSKKHKYNVKMAAMRGNLLNVLAAREQQLQQQEKLKDDDDSEEAQPP